MSSLRGTPLFLPHKSDTTQFPISYRTLHSEEETVMSLGMKSAVLTAALWIGGYIVNAQAQRLAVVVNPDAGEVERFAAEEMQRYLEKITGEKVPVGAEAPEGATALLVGGGGIAADQKAALGEEGYTLQTTNRGLVLAGGGPRGTLYAVYDFLERLGCRWYYPDPQDEIVPRVSLAEVVCMVRSGLQVKEKPDFSVRMPVFLTYDLGPAGTPIATAIMKTLPHVVDWTAKNRMNIFQYGIDHTPRCCAHWGHYRDVFPEMRRRGLTIGVGGHCGFMFISRDDLKEHPDWKPMVNGKRKYLKCQFCTRNEEAVRFYIANVIRFLKENPEVEYFIPWPEDGSAWCKCPLCKDTPVADRYMELSRRIYRELKQAVPHVRVSLGAYGTHLSPPEKVRPLAGMTVTFVAWGRDLAIPFDDARTRKLYRDAFARWRDICKQNGASLLVQAKWARHLLVGFHPLPLPILQADCRWFREQGLAGFELPWGYMGRRTKSFNLYVLARLMWDADADVEAIVADYFTRFYGQSGTAMRKAYEEVERAQPDLRYGHNCAVEELPRHPTTPFSADARDYVTNAVKHLRQAQGHLQQALRVAGHDAVRGRIRRFDKSLTYLALEWEALARIVEAERYMGEAETAKDTTQYGKRLDAAEQALQAAKKLSDERQELAVKSPGCGLYWDVIGPGVYWHEQDVIGPGRPRNVFNPSQIDAWLKVLASKRAFPVSGTVWQLGVFDARSSEFGRDAKQRQAMLQMPERVRYEVGRNWREITRWPDFPPAHWPRNAGHGAVIEIVFEADAGEYVFTLGQLPTGTAETVTLLVDGDNVGAFTTLTLTVTNAVTEHKLPFVLKAGGRHTLTLSECGNAGGYGIDAIRLERLRQTDQ